MSELKVDTVVNLAGTGKPNFQNGVTINGAAPSTLNLNEYTESASEPSSPSNGALWWDTANEKTFIYAEGEWKETIGIAASISWGGDRGVIFRNQTTNKEIDYVDITTTGNASDFGDQTVARAFSLAAASDGTYGLTAGGSNWVSDDYQDSIEYVTIATTGNGTDFGDLNNGGGNSCGALGDGTLVLFTRGFDTNTPTNDIMYVTAATPANSQDFGDLSRICQQVAGCSNGTRGLWGGGSTGTSGSYDNIIEYVTTATTGNVTDFGDLTVARRGLASASDATYGVWIGGTTGSNSNVIDFVTMDTTGNATDFGDDQVARLYVGATSNGTRAIIAGGNQSTNEISYITIATTGDATDFGDLNWTATMGAPCASGAAS